MELRQLRYFLEIAQQRSICKTAEKLFIAQPALSRQLQNLECEMQVKLFEREPRGVRLTQAGEQFYKDIEKIHNDLVQAVKRAQQVASGQIGELHIGLTVLHGSMPQVWQIISAAQGKSAEIFISLLPMLSGPQLDKLKSGELDAGLLYCRPPEDEAFSALKICTERMVLVVKKGSPADRCNPKKLADLNNEDFIWLPRQATPVYYDYLVNHFHTRGFFPHVVLEGTDNTALLALVSSGLGCSILPITAQHHAPETLRFIELEDLDIYLTLEFVWLTQNDNPALLRLVEIVRTSVTKGEPCL